MMPDDPTATGLPGVKTWGGVYLLVTVILAMWVVLLAELARVFS
jgi:hypothetical protein